MGRMRRLDEAFERRRHLRVSQRLSCALLAHGRRHEGVVCDVSPGSLRVQTPAELPCGTGVVVSLNLPEGGLVLLEASVRERRTLPRSLAAALPDAAVLDVEAPPPAWLRFVDDEIARAS
jgi:hypothetical protein